MEVVRGQNGGEWTARVLCPAKINWFLEIISRRPDGYHELETLITTISIYDSLYITVTAEEDIRLTCDWAAGMQARGDGLGGGAKLPAETENLAYRAARRLADESGVPRGARLRLVKRIPSEAGLGGASSDAAATLVALNEGWGLHWSRPRLAELAAELGSDVPFFLTERTSGCRTAVCRGRGEQICSLPGVPRLYLVVVKPPEGLSTAAVFRRCVVPERPRRGDDLAAALTSGIGSRVGALLFNRLQETAETLSPPVASCRQRCAGLDVMGHAMSGSGTSYYALCRSARHARQVAGRLRAWLGGQVFTACTV